MNTAWVLSVLGKWLLVCYCLLRGEIIVCFLCVVGSDYWFDDVCGGGS